MNCKISTTITRVQNEKKTKNMRMSVCKKSMDKCLIPAIRAIAYILGKLRYMIGIE